MGITQRRPQDTQPREQRYRWSFCVCWLFLLYSPAQAQYGFDHWTADNGLPQNTVRDILQTRDGYLWLTTFDGLVRFDGVRFTVFNKSNSPGIIINRFLYLYEDSQGDLWASTENTGITRLHRGHFTTYTTENGLPKNLIDGMGGDEQGNLIIACGFQWVRWLDGKFAPLADLRLPGRGPHLLAAQHLPFYSDRSSKMACYVDGRIRLWDLAQFPPGPVISSPSQDHLGNTWFGFDGGLIKTENGRVVKVYTKGAGLEGQKTRLVYGQMPLQAVSVGDDNSLWLTDVGTMQNTLMARRAPEELNFEMSYADREGNYWFGTIRNGLFRARKQSVTAHLSSQGQVTSEVYPLYEDREGAIWIGTGVEGVYRFKDGALTAYRGDTSGFGNYITSVNQDRAGRIWVNGVWRFEEGRFVRRISRDVIPTSSDVWAMYEDSEGMFWFGTSNGVVRYKEGSATLYTTKDGLAGNDTKVIIEDKTGSIWLGSYGGLTHFKDGRFTSWTELDGLPGNTVRALHQDDDGALWIGTYDSGLGRLKDGKFTRYTIKDGMFDNGVFQILDDGKGWYWMGCNRGIYRIRKQELEDFAAGKIKAVTSIVYSKSDGMLNVECNGGRWPAGIRTHDGKLWFPTMSGVAVVDPATVMTNVQPPPVVIETVRIDNQPVAVETMASGVRIEPGQHNFEIDYTALSFINSENLRFRYKLEGRDPDWVEAGARRTAYFSYVAPGEYTFKVIAANRDGVWNEEGRLLRITVVPPFYRRWWFMTLAGLVVAGLMWSGYRYRVEQLKRAQTAQEAFSRQLLISQEHERKRIATGLHDSLGQQLLVIKNWAMIEINRDRENNQPREAINEISDTASQAIEEVRRIIYDLRPYQLDKIGLGSTIRFMLEKVSAASGVKFEIAIGEVDKLLPYDSELILYRIIQECVNNIIKHSHASVAVIRLQRDEHHLRLTVEDDGCGFRPQAVEPPGVDNHGRSGLGLTGISERVRMLGGTHSIDSSPGKGTRIIISINTERKT